MAFQYKHVLMIGGTSGIGKAMADRLIKAGAKVTVVGRRQDRINDFVKAHGEDKASGVHFDISKVDEIPQFVAQVTKSYPDIDCVFLNAGMQRNHDFSKPESVDLKAYFAEFDVNYKSMVILTHTFLPFLESQKTQTSLIFTGTNVAIVPAAIMPAYSGSKGALHAFVLCLREQLYKSSVKVLEISPPAVQTELHDHMGEEIGRKIGMPLDAFTEEAYSGLVAGNPTTYVGSIGNAEIFKEVVEKQMFLFNFLTAIFLPKN